MVAWFSQKYRRWLPVLLLGVLAVMLLAFPPRWGFRLAGGLAPGAIYFADTDEKVVALTIDDGPSPETTGQVLDVLAQFGGRATFFLLTDNIPGQEAIVRRLVAEGHELGNHLTADEASIRLADDEFEQKLKQADGILSRYAEQNENRPIRWLRPGVGWYTQPMVQTANAAGYRLALGSVFPYDTHLPFVGFTRWFVLANVKPGDIIVLHDGPKRGQRTAAALAHILPQLQAKGYEVVTLSDLFNR